LAKSKTPAKRIRQAEANRLINKSYKSSLKTAISKYEASLQENDLETSKKMLVQVTSLIDKSVSKGILHKNTAGRKKSKLSKKLSQLSK